MVMLQYMGPVDQSKKPDLDGIEDVIQLWTIVNARADGLDLLRQANEALFQSGQRVDAQTSSTGFHLARELEHLYPQIIEEKYAPLGAFKLFGVDSSVPAGAEYHTVRREYEYGEVQEFATGADVEVKASVQVGRDEERFPVRHYATSFKYSLFQQMSANYANSGYLASLLRTGRNKMMEHANFRTWHGNALAGMYGVLNYPWIERWDVGPLLNSSASFTTLKDALSDFVNRPHENSRTVYKPNRVVMSPRMRNRFFKVSNAASSDISAGKWFLENNQRGIREIEEADELAGAGPGSSDVILIYFDGFEGPQNVIVNPFSLIPIQQQGFSYHQLMYMSHGGVIVRAPVSCLIVYAQF
jgi:hypothetical protein